MLMYVCLSQYAEQDAQDDLCCIYIVYLSGGEGVHHYLSALCGRRGCKNKPVLFPDRMS